MPPESDPSFEALLEHLKDSRAFDFTGYKRASLVRRVARRIDALGLTGPSEYLDHLQVHPEEFTTLFNTILINVTEFFRDPEAWQHLETDLLPALLASRAPGEPIRVWTAGCASGEEAYSLAIVLAEAMGIEDFRDRVKIYATDVDEEALAHARQAVYDEAVLQNVRPELLERYFELQGGRYAFRKDLRRSVIIGRNDLVQDAPISRIDLLVCRNVLIYFTAETQARILRRFHFALADDGVMFLGKAEMLLGHATLFAPVDPRRRFFRRTPASAGGGLDPLPRSRHNDPDAVALADRMRDEVLVAGPVPQVVIGPDGRLASANRQAEVLFAMSPRDVGRSFGDLEISYRPVELRRWIDQAHVDRRTTRIKDVEWVRGADVIQMEVQVTPLVDRSGRPLGTLVSYHDTSEAHRLRVDLERANRQLETAYEELQSTNEELETTNEELQSTVEELETTNEELQSTNEELETMNEELQSTNDELQTINEELRERTEQVHDVNAFLQSVLGGLRGAVVVLDRDLIILVWSRQAEDLWGLRRDEAVGRHFLTLEIGLPVERLAVPLRRVSGDDAEPFDVTVAGRNRFGRDIEVRAYADPLRDDRGEVLGAVLVLHAA